MLVPQLLVVLAGVLNTAIGVGHETFAGQFALHGHLQGIDHEATLHVVSHRPTDDLRRAGTLEELSGHGSLLGCDGRRRMGPKALCDARVGYRRSRCGSGLDETSFTRTGLGVNRPRPT